MKKAIIISLGIVVLLVLPMVSADTMSLGFRGMSINNYISNLNDFPEYVFVSGPTDNSGPGIGTCKVQVIQSDGKIPGAYKFCDISVYAVKKSYFSQDLINEFNSREGDYREIEAKYKEFLDSPDVMEILTNINSYTQVPITSSRQSIKNEYVVDINLPQTEPNKTITGRNSLIYFYIIIPLVALILIIIIILIIRKSKK